MNDDFSTLHLYLRECYKLFLLRFKKRAPKEYFGCSFRDLHREKLISDESNWFESAPNQLYSLTDRYFRYCVYRREQFFAGNVWSGIIAAVTAAVTTIVMRLLGLQ